jgi:hypothetical protein
MFHRNKYSLFIFLVYFHKIFHVRIWNGTLVTDVKPRVKHTSLAAAIFQLRIIYKARYLSSCNSSVGIATDYGLDSRVLIPGRGKRFFLYPQRSDQFWGPPESKGYRVVFLGEGR